MAFESTIQTDETSKIIEVMLRDSSTGAGKTGLAFGDLSVSYVREGSTRVAVTLASGTAGDAYSSGKVAEVDATNMKGVYQIHLPDAAFVTGVDAVTFQVQATGVIDKTVRFSLASMTTTEVETSTTAALTSFNATETDSYVYGDQTVFRTLVKSAFSRCQRIAVLGDSQEASPGGTGKLFVHRLNANTFYAFGAASESHICYPVSNANNAWTRTSNSNFTGTTYSIAQLPETAVKNQSATSNGFYALLNPTADDSGGMTPDTKINARETWLPMTTLVADIFLYGDAGSPDQVRVLSMPNEEADANYFKGVDQTLDTDLSLSTVSGWVKHTTATITPDPLEPYPALVIQGFDGAAVATGLISGGLRFRDASRDEGMVFQSFGDGGSTTAAWETAYTAAGPQFLAYGPWDAIFLCFGANDAGNSVTAADFKIAMQSIVDMLCGSGWSQPNTPVIIVSDPEREVGGSFTSGMAAELSAYPAKMIELAAENSHVSFIDMYTLMSDAGFDPTTGIGTTDGVHLTDEWKVKRADFLFQEIIRFAGKTGFSDATLAQQLATKAVVDAGATTVQLNSRTLATAGYFDASTDTVSVAAMSTAALAQFATTDTGETTAVSGSVAALGQGAAGVDQATGTAQDEIKALLAAGAVYQGPVSSDGETVTVIQGDSYTALELAWTVSTDYTVGFTGVFTVTSKYDATAVYMRTPVTVNSSTSIGVAQTAVFDIDPKYSGCPPTAHLRFALTMIETSSSNEESILGDYLVKGRGATS